MPGYEYIVLMGIGAFFILFGLFAVVKAKKGERGYYNSLSFQNDLREYMEHWPPRSSFGAWMVSGCIMLALGALLLALGIVFGFYL